MTLKLKNNTIKMYRINFKVHPDEYSSVCYGDTDSVFIILKTKTYKEFTELDANDPRLASLKTKLLEESFETGKKLAGEISEVLFKDPIKLEFEKVYYPLILFSKKRYIGNYYGKSPHTIDFTEKKGIVLKRRDNPDIVKKLYQAFIDPVLEYGRPGVEKAVNHLKAEIIKILENKNDIADLIVTKSLSKSYGKERCHINDCGKPATRQSPKKLFYCKKHSEEIPDCTVMKNVYTSENSPHIALCKKIAERDPGASPVVGDRINYVFVDTGNPKAKLFEKAEDPVYAVEHNLKMDVLYYINNQLKKPISEVLQFLIDDHETFFDKLLEQHHRRNSISKHFLKYVGDPNKVI